jgi:hypothetical protein
VENTRETCEKLLKMIRICARSVQNLALKRGQLGALTVSRDLCDKVEKKEETVTSTESKLGGFAKAFEKFSTAPSDNQQQEEKLPDLPFATLLRNSKLIDVSCTKFLSRAGAKVYFSLSSETLKEKLLQEKSST